MQTRRKLIDKVLDNLGILVPGQAPGDEAVARVDGVIDPGLATLNALGIPAYIGDPGDEDPPTGGEIDDALFLPLSDWMTWKSAGAFNLASDPALKVLADQAEEDMRTIGRPARTRQVLRTDDQLRGIRTRLPVGNFTRGT